MEPNKQTDKADNKDEFEKVRAIAPMAVGLREILSDFRFKRLSTAANWILAGTIAFIYSILSEPAKFVESYGQWQSKTALILFAISFFYGIKNIISSQALSAVMGSETLKTLVEFNHFYDKNVEPEDKDEKIKKPIEQVVGEGLGNALIFHLKGTRSFWLQLFTFITGAGVFLVTFLVKDF